MSFIDGLHLNQKEHNPNCNWEKILLHITVFCFMQLRGTACHALSLNIVLASCPAVSFNITSCLQKKNLPCGKWFNQKENMDFLECLRFFLFHSRMTV